MKELCCDVALESVRNGVTLICTLHLNRKALILLWVCTAFALLFISDKPQDEETEFQVKGASTKHFVVVVVKERISERKKLGSSQLEQQFCEGIVLARC